MWRAPPLRISEPTRENLLAIAQQAIRNAIQHSSPTSILVHLLFKDRALALSIKDDGCGFDPSERTLYGGQFGLKGMKERAEQISGKLDIVSGEGKGTQVTVQVCV